MKKDEKNDASLCDFFILAALLFAPVAASGKPLQSRADQNTRKSESGSQSKRKSVRQTG